MFAAGLQPFENTKQSVRLPMAESSEDLEKRWLAQATYLSDFALINAIYTSPECSTFVARCLLRNFPWPERTYLLKLEAAGSQVRNEANLSVLQEEASIFVDLDTARTAKLLAQFEDTVGHFLMPHSGEYYCNRM